MNELPEAEILAGETFKSMITGDDMTARPIRESPFTFAPRAGHLYAANRLPGSNDQSHGFWRRWIVLTFNRRFAESEQDATIGDRIIASDLAGIVSWMIEGARRLLAQGHYTLPPSSAEAVSNWKRGADPVAQFVKEKTRPVRAAVEREKARDLFLAYVDWAKENQFKIMSSHTFGHRMRSLGMGSEHTNTGEVYPVVRLAFGEVQPPDPKDPKAVAAAEEAELARAAEIESHNAMCDCGYCKQCGRCWKRDEKEGGCRCESKRR